MTPSLNALHCVTQFSPPFHSTVKKYMLSSNGHLTFWDLCCLLSFSMAPSIGPFLEALSLLSFPHHHFGQLEAVQRGLCPHPLKAVQKTSEMGTNGSSNSSLFLSLWAFFPQNSELKTPGLKALWHQLASLLPPALREP